MERTPTEILDMTIFRLREDLVAQRIRLLNDLLLESAKGHSNVTLRIVHEGATNLSECLHATTDQTREAFTDAAWAL